MMVVLDYLATAAIFDVQHGVTQQELASRTGIPEGSIGEVVERGVNVGWLARELQTRGPGLGGQEFAIYLTRAGWAVAPSIRIAREIAAQASFAKSGL